MKCEHKNTKWTKVRFCRDLSKVKTCKDCHMIIDYKFKKEVKKK